MCMDNECLTNQSVEGPAVSICGYLIVLSSKTVRTFSCKALNDRIVFGLLCVNFSLRVAFKDTA